MQSFKISNSRIIFETIEDNTLIINLEVGHYFNLNSTGSAIWKLLILGTPSSLISEELSARYNIDASQTNNDLSQFIDNLKMEGILVENQIPDGTQSINKETYPADETKTYETPSFIKYTDMEALLLADPIHEFINES
jgi:hypothetical protein